MSSNLRVNNILPSVGTNVAIGTAGGSITLTGGVTGSSIINTGVTTVSAGSTSAPSISPTGDSNTGIFFPSPDTVAIVEGGVEALRVNSSGNIGIGTTDSLNKFEVGNVSGGVTAPDFTVSTVSLGSSVTIGRLSSVGSDNTFFRVRDRVNRTLISATVGGVDIGSTDVTTPLTIRNGNLVFSTAGTGIDFSAASNAAGMTSELLDDYEEGTWTCSFNGSFTTATGYYTKIGNLVHIQVYGSGLNVQFAVVAQISGLPFTVRSSYSVGAANHNTYSTNGDNFYFSTDSTVALFYQENTISQANVNVGNPRYVMMAGSYITDS